MNTLYPGWIFLGSAVIGFGLCYLLVPLCKYFSWKMDLLDVPGGHKVHEEATPLLGGLAVFIALWLTLGAFAWKNLFTWDRELQGILIGSCLIFLMGLIDDLWDLSPMAKFFVQVGAALVVILHGVSVSLFMGQNFITIGITVLWIVGITNSFNMLDNMDGLTTGVAAICCLIFSIVAFRQRDFQTVYLTTTMLGALIAFLRFNFTPSELFLGDAGSGFIGFFLATISVAANYLEHTQLRHLPIITPLLIFSLPLFDTFSVMAIRLMEGRPVWDADNCHFSHRLVKLGLNRSAAVLVIYLVTFTVGILATLLTRVNRADAILLLLHAAAIFAIIILLEYSSTNQQAKENNFDD